jgi:hypothetical protein
MNERIKELAREAGLLVHNPTGVPTKLEKFAELIVAECIDAVSDCSVEYCTRPQIVSEIKEHFGVEE